jgi:hypothetical protein
MMSKHTHSRPSQPAPPAASSPRKPDAQRPDTTGTPAKSQAKPRLLAAPQRRLSSEEQFQLTQMRAYYLWEQAGRPDGDAARERFWFLAESEITPPPPGA